MSRSRRPVVDQRAKTVFDDPGSSGPRRVMSGEVGVVVDGRYRVVRAIGAGASGSVFEARDTETRKRVALKLLHDNLLESQEHVDRFLRETRTAVGIDHPGVVRFLDSGRDHGGRPYLVQEFLHGENMEQSLDAGVLQVAQIFEVTLQLLDALAAVHETGLVHRDVKPENVLLTHDEFGQVRAKLVDFGIARPAQTDTTLTAAGTIVGTPHYMSPEQVQGLPVNASTDLWAVGVLLYQALTRKMPFDGNSTQLVLVAVLAKTPVPFHELRPDLPSWLGDIIGAALQRDRTRRFRSARAMAAALRAGIRFG